MSAEDPLHSAFPSREGWVFAAVLIALVAATLEPLWSQTIPALQDYPYHLAQVEILSSETPSSYESVFRSELKVQPYAAFYAVALGLTSFVDVEVAGKLTLSLYFLLFALLILRGLRGGNVPWGALLLLPLAYHPPYYLGFLNYLFSLPLLGLALQDYDDWCAHEGSRGAAGRLSLWILGLYLTHPFTYLAFLGLAGLRAIMLPTRKEFHAWIPILLAAAVFVVWFLTQDGGEGVSGPEGIHWLSFGLNLTLYTYPFTGMQSWGDASVALVLVWIGLVATLVFAYRESRPSPMTRFWALALVLTTIAVFVVPFRMGHYSYISWRIASISYLCLGMVAAGLRFRGHLRWIFVALIAVTIGFAGEQQRSISAEFEEVLPLIEAIPPDRAVLPLVYDSDSPRLDSPAFDPHLHVHHYYHVRRGGGVTPYFFPHPLVPVRYRDGQPPPAPIQYQPQNYRPKLHAEWEYLLVRSAPPRVIEFFRRRGKELARNGRWRLFRVADPETQRQGRRG